MLLPISRFVLYFTPSSAAGSTSSSSKTEPVAATGPLQLLCHSLPLKTELAESEIEAARRHSGITDRTCRSSADSVLSAACLAIVAARRLPSLCGARPASRGATIPGPIAEAFADAENGRRQPTPSNALGPFYRRGAPDGHDLRGATDPGLPLIVTGAVIDTRGEARPDATVEVWQADHFGHYDIDGYRYRATLAPDGKGGTSSRR